MPAFQMPLIPVRWWQLVRNLQTALCILRLSPALAADIPPTPPRGTGFAYLNYMMTGYQTDSGARLTSPRVRSHRPIAARGCPRAPRGQPTLIHRSEWTAGCLAAERIQTPHPRCPRTRWRDRARHPGHRPGRGAVVSPPPWHGP